MKKVIYPTAALLTAFALTPMETVKADSQTSSTISAVEEVVSTNSTESQTSSAESDVTVTDPQNEGLKQPVVLSNTDTLESEAEVPTSPRVEKLLSEMSLDQKISQMLMPDFRKWQSTGEDNPTDVTQLNEEVATAIDKYDFGGVILFAENVKGTKQTLELTQDMQRVAIENKAKNGNIPLLLAIDQEGGIVYRLGSGTALPGNMAVGATNSPELAREAGQIIGRELSALGLNIDFAPVLDTNNNPQNPVIGLRSFSSDPERVARLGIPMMQGIQEYNVAVAAKHFPGHGDTAVDSHTGLPLVDKSIDELEKLELYPFKKAMDAGVDLLMTAHIQYPQIEKDQVISKETGEPIYVPATLSDDILTGIVREKYGYKGVIVSDAMGMDAIAKNFGEVEAVKMAINAGVDLVLMPTSLRKVADLTKIDRIIQEVAHSVATGEILESRLNQSVRRILTLKEKRGVLDFNLSDRTVEKAESAVGSDLNRELERKIAAAAVTVVKNEDNVLPFKVSEQDKILLLGAYQNEVPGLNLGMRRLIADGVLPKKLSFVAKHYTKDSDLETFKDDLEAATHIIIISEIGRESQLQQDVWLTKFPTDIVNYANQTGKKVAVMSISKPYDVGNYPQAKAILAVYGNKGMDPTEALKPDNAFGPNIPAGVEVIFNGREHLGTLPVDIPKIVDGKLSQTEFAYRLGHGLTYQAEQPPYERPQADPQSYQNHGGNPMMTAKPSGETAANHMVPTVTVETKAQTQHQEIVAKEKVEPLGLTSSQLSAKRLPDTGDSASSALLVAGIVSVVTAYGLMVKGKQD